MNKIKLSKQVTIFLFVSFLLSGFVCKNKTKDMDTLNKTTKNGTLKIAVPREGVLTGARDQKSIMKTVMPNLAALRYTYNSRLREQPGIKGRITVKFAIDEFGTILSCVLVNSSVNDSKLEQTVLNRIKKWKFEKIDSPGDVTEVVYPLMFSSP